MPSRKGQLSSTPTDDTLPVFSLRFADTQNIKTYHMMKQIAQIISSSNVIILVDNKNDQQQQMESRLKKYKMDGDLPEDTLILSDSLTHKSLSTEFKKMFRENRKEQIMILKFNFFIVSFSCDTKEINNGSIENADINIITNEIIMTNPKSITGFMSDKTKEKKATTVVKKV